jgi:hypothetical protein
MRAAAHPVFGRRTRQKSLFVRIIEALHISRRIEARRLLRRHRHLIAEDFLKLPGRASPDFNQAGESTANANATKPLGRTGNRIFQNV